MNNQKISQTNSFYSEKELTVLGIKKFGKNILISRKASIYDANKLSLGDNIRIDDFCILTGEIELGSYVHISAFCALYGKNKIKINDFSGLSPRVTVFSESDDFSGNFLINPLVPDEFRNLISGKVELDNFVQVGAGSVVMPRIRLNTGSVIASMSFVNRSVEEWTIAGGIPIRDIKKRDRGLLDKYNAFTSKLRERYAR